MGSWPPRVVWAWVCTFVIVYCLSKLFAVSDPSTFDARSDAYPVDG